MRRSSLVLSSGLVAALVAVLGVLGALQYRWLSQVSRAERERLGRDAQRRAEAFAQDLDREVTRAYVMLQVPPEPRVAGTSAAFAERWDRWTARAPHPGLVAAVYLVETPPEGQARLSRFDPARRAFVGADWPAALQDLRRHVEPSPRQPPPMPVLAGGPALVSPVPDILPLGNDAGPGADGGVRRVLLTANHERVLSHRRAGRWPAWGYTVLLLDPAYLTGHLLPALARRHLAGPEGPEYDATVLGPASGMVWASGPPRWTADAEAPALRVRFDDLERSLLDSLDEKPAPGRDHFRFRLAAGFLGKGEDAEGGGAGWRVALAHRKGSLDALAASLRRRNLAVSFGILGLLGASMALVVTSSQRARALAARQMEFVAGVSHELRTPVAVIRSAAENLNDGVVSEAGQVRRYGGVMLDQAARLTAMVEQVLALAGAEARAREPQRIAPAELVRGAAADPADPAGSAAQVVVEAGLPEISGDPDALRRALANLVANARRHAPGSPLRIRARRGEGGGVDIEVEDGGPGIEPADLPHLFEPFYRGRRAVADQVPGSGLGLAVVRGVTEAHGGRVSVRSQPGGGATFTLHLPAPSAR